MDSRGPYSSSTTRTRRGWTRPPGLDRGLVTIKPETVPLWHGWNMMCVCRADTSTVKHPCVTATYAFLVFAAGVGPPGFFSRAAGPPLAERLKAAENENAGSPPNSRRKSTPRGPSSRVGKARLGAELAAERAGAEARVAELRSAHERLKGEFAELSATALRANRDEFLKLAEQSFSQLRDKSAGDLASRQQAIDALVKPLRDSLEKVDAKINELEQRRERAYGELGRQLESLSSAQLRMHAETTKLSTALSTTRTAGTWGRSSCGAWWSWPG